MNILSLTLEQSRITRPELLNWIISPEIKGGIETDKHWILSTSLEFGNPTNDHEAEKLKVLYFLCITHNYKILIIQK